MVPGYREFEFDLPAALLTHLVDVLDSLVAAPLNPATLTSIPEAQGVYQLFLDSTLVYIGKTDSEAGLKVRLERHQRAIQHRIGLDPGRVSFRAVRVFVFTAIDLETQLIKHYGGYSSVVWNGSGFGSNDPGRNRDKTEYKPNHFDMIYPIDVDRILTTSILMAGNANNILMSLKNALPYVFRFERNADLNATLITLPTNISLTARQVIAATVSNLPPGWQATKLPNRIILYKENQTYMQGTVIGRS